MHQIRLTGQASPTEAVVLDTEDSDVGSGDVTVASVFRQLYMTCLQPVRKRRNDFLLSLLRRCEKCCVTQTVDLRATSFDISSATDTTAAIPAASVAKGASATTSTTTAGNGSTQHAAAGRPSLPSPLASRTVDNSPGKTPTPGKPSPLPKATGKPDANPEAISGVLHNIQLVQFLCETLAYLPYNQVDEPLHLIHYINRNVSVQAEQLTSHLRTQLQYLGAAPRIEGAMQPPAIGFTPGKSLKSPATKTGSP